MITDFHLRRSRVEARIDELIAKAGIALLDNEPYDDHGELEELRAELTILDAAEAEAGRRLREASDQAKAERRRQLTNRLIRENAVRLHAVKEAESAAETLAERINAMHAATAIVRKTIVELGELVPLSLTENAIKRRLALRLGEFLSSVFVGRYEIGDLKWRAGRLRSWLDTDKAATSPDIFNITGVRINGHHDHSREEA